MNASLWRANSEITYRLPINNSATFDVSIIGGGFSGLWSAYHLKQIQPSLKIAIFEKEYVGFGASGRNGGWASAEYPTSSGRLIKEHGLAVYQQLRASLIESISEIGQIAAQNNWDIDFAKGGALVFATNNPQLTRISKDIDDEHQLLSRAEVLERVNIPKAVGGVFTPHCAALNPYRLCRLLAQFLEKNQVEIFEKSTVSKIGGGEIIANGYTIKTNTSILATEAFTPLPWQDNKQIPIYSLMVATEPLPKTVMAEIKNTSRMTLQEGCHLITYAQFTGDNRLAIGGRGVRYKLFSRLSERSEKDNRMHNALERRAKSWFPQLADSKFEYHWGGPVALTRRWQAYLNFDKSSRVAKIGGYVGDGVTLSYLVAKTLAQIICGQKTPNLPFIEQRVGRWEIEPIRYLAVNAGFKATVAADFEERLTNRPSVLASIINPLINR
jgi:glycine/D-amino acid oxidase-like deaminating enzyme